MGREASFWTKLSREWGIPKWMLQRILPSSEFSELMVAYEINPWGDDWLQAATIARCSLRAGGYKPGGVETFIPILRRPVKSAEQIYNTLISGLTAQQRTNVTPPPRG